MLQVIADVFTPSNTRFILKGLALTVFISIGVVLVSIVFGTVLAIARTYEKRLLGKIAAVYIETFRNTPLLLWIIGAVFIIPRSLIGSPMMRGSFGLMLYTSSVISEIVRGGINSIHSGQYEAARSQGFNFAQVLFFVVLPQTFERIIPSLMSQIVTTIKDTSFFAQVGIAEFFWSMRNVMSSLSKNVVITTAHVFVIYVFIALVYFVINFTLSCAVRAMRRRLADA
ncbi:MAG: amino acid ABC transporter permease [Oscillospiraceae bacterium]|nr:amino acid ABC transporter permease [Oscillospiraceae bacterium]